MQNEKVQELFSQKDRDGLLRYLAPMYESLRSEFPQATIAIAERSGDLKNSMTRFKY